MNLVHFLSTSSASAGVLGGIIGTVGAAAANIKDYKKGDIDATEASIAVGKEGISTGVATGVSAAAAGAVGSSLVLTVGTALAVGIGAKYLWDAGVDKLEQQLTEKDELDKELLETEVPDELVESTADSAA